MRGKEGHGFIKCFKWDRLEGFTGDLTFQQRPAVGKAKSWKAKLSENRFLY